MDSNALLPGLLFLGGLAVLLVSAKYFVDGIAVLAERMGASPVLVGMTVVAFGTSTPELVVNVLSATKGETQLAFGNVVGSCVVNVGFVLALTALIRPLRVEPSLITREIPMLILAVASVMTLAWDGRIGRSDGVMLLLLFAVFVYYTAVYSLAKKVLAGDAFAEEIKEDLATRPQTGLTRDLILTVLGLTGVSLGANWVVEGATGVAHLIGMSDALIGLTVVSVGTTLPELVTCVMAARRGDPDIALGNVVGSNLFNIMAIGGLVAAVEPIAVPPGGSGDLALMALLTAVLMPIAIRSGRTITRGEGALLLLIYVAYMVWRVSEAVR